MTIAVQTAQNGDTATDTAVARNSDTVAAGLSRTSPVAGYLVTLTIETWTVFVQSLVGMARDLFDGFAVEVRKVIGLAMDDDHQAGLCLDDPTRETPPAAGAAGPTSRAPSPGADHRPPSTRGRAHRPDR